MKYLLLITGILVCGFVSAQKDEVYYLQKQIKKKLEKKITGFPNYQSSNSIKPQKEVAYVLSNGNNVSVLPQDNMPCIKPDMSQFNMPCVKPEKQTYNMPVLKGTSNEIASQRIDFHNGKIVKERKVTKRF